MKLNTLLRLFLSLGAGLFMIGSALAQTTGAAASSRHPWDDRPNKCFMETGVPASPGCRLDFWPNYYKTMQRMSQAISQLDIKLLEDSASDLMLSGKQFPTGEYLFEAMNDSLWSSFGHTSTFTQDRLAKWSELPGASGVSCVAGAINEHGKAWEARGDGMAGTVSPESWALYYSHLDAAAARLDACPANVKTSGPWYLVRLRLTYQSPKLKAQQKATLSEASTMWPDSVRLYAIPINFVSPQWGGSFEEMDAVAAFAAFQSKRLGDGMYALVYEAAFRGQGDGRHTLKSTVVDWERMKNGFRHLESLGYGQPTLWAHFTDLACQVRDRAEARRLLAIYDKLNPSFVDRPTAGCRKFALAD